MKPQRILSSLKALGAAALCVVMAPAVASADPTRVLVLPYAPLYESIPRATGEQIANTFEEGLRGKSSVELRSLPAESAGASAKAATDEQKAAVMEARADLERGRDLLSRRRVPQALRAFEASIEKLKANAIALENTEALQEALLRRAAALFLMGREVEAEKGPIVEALVLNPGVRLEESDGYGKPFIELVEKVRQGEIAERGYGELRVDTTPPGALVWVDGREALTSPVRVSGIVPGTHYISIKLPSVDTYTEVVEIQKDALFRISPDDEGKAEGPVTTLVTHLSKNQLDDAAKTQLAALARRAEADMVVFGGAFADGAEMGIVSYVYSVADDSIASLQRVTLNREMLGATIEINRVSTEFLERLPDNGEALSLPVPLAADAKPGAEKINEVDLSVNYAAFKESGSSSTRPTSTRGPRRPIGTPRAPIGAPQPPAGGGAAPELGAATPALEEPPAEDFAQAVTPVPQEDFLDFRDAPTEPEPSLEPMPSYTFSGGVGIEDEVPLSETPQVRKGGLLNRWWFWTGAAIVVGGAVTAGIAMSGGDGVTGNASW